jgi:hypothetical protein
VTCAENILAGGPGDAEMTVVRDAKVLATNIFQREGGAWKLVLHHGSPVLPP